MCRLWPWLSATTLIVFAFFFILIMSTAFIIPDNTIEIKTISYEKKQIKKLKVVTKWSLCTKGEGGRRGCLRGGIKKWPKTGLRRLWTTPWKKT